MIRIGLIGAVAQTIDAVFEAAMKCIAGNYEVAGLWLLVAYWAFIAAVAFFVRWREA